MNLQAEGKQPATLVRHLAVLKATFNRAKRLGLMKENPATLVKPPKVNNPRNDSPRVRSSQFLGSARPEGWLLGA